MGIKNTSYTKGEWTYAPMVINSNSDEVEIGSLHLAVGVKETKTTICLITPLSKKTDEDEANAKLISAAPNIYEALQNLLIDIASNPNDFNTRSDNPFIEKAEQALKKVTE